MFPAAVLFSKQLLMGSVKDAMVAERLPGIGFFAQQDCPGVR
jgi:hypothetical protein